MALSEKESCSSNAPYNRVRAPNTLSWPWIDSHSECATGAELHAPGQDLSGTPCVPTFVTRSSLIIGAKQDCQINYKRQAIALLTPEVFQLVFQSEFKINIYDNNQ